MTFVPCGQHEAPSESPTTNAASSFTELATRHEDSVEPPFSGTGVKFDLEQVDYSCLASIKDIFLLTALYNAGKITHDDYVKLKTPLTPPEPTYPPPDPTRVDIVYSSQSPPIISPVDVIELSRARQLHPEGYCISNYVSVISNNLLVKCKDSQFGIENEARTMLLIQEHTSIPVPKVHLVFNYFDSTYIVMDFIDGADLQHLWLTLGEGERQSVLSQVQRYLHEFRSISPASTVPGPLNGGICDGPWFSSEGSGPFVSHQHLVKWLNSFIESPRRPPLSDQRFTADAPLVFTHRDFLPRNLILSHGTVWVIDWELSGWFPPYMEYCSIADDIGHPDCRTPPSWREAVLPMLDDYQREYKLLCKVAGEIAFAYRRGTISPPHEARAETTSPP